MTRTRRNSTDVLGFLLLWALVSLLAFSPAVPGDTLGSLLAGVLVTLVVIAALTVRRTDDLLFGLSRTPRGPTVAEQRLRGVDYEAARDPRLPDNERAALADKMTAVWAQIPTPAGIAELTELGGCQVKPKVYAPPKTNGGRDAQ